VTPRRWRIIAWVLLLAAAAPAVGQVALLAIAIAGRHGYPYDLEWMEGGILQHAARIARGEGVFVEPSVEFVPFPYPPLYPGLIAALAPVFGLSYQLARGISALALVALVALVPAAIVGASERLHRAEAWIGSLIALGLFAATYPWVEGWLDIARGDTLLLALIVGGITAAAAWAPAGDGWRGHARVAAAAAVLALAYFCKQTGVFFVLAGGAIVAVADWRRAPTFAAVAGVIGLGGTWLLDRATGGWFWTYAYEVLAAQDFSRDRFVQSFGSILGKFPVMTAVIAAALVAVGVARYLRRQLSSSVRPLLVWSAVFAVGCVTGALGWGTQWAHFNAYLPAMVAGAIAAGAAIPAIADATAALRPDLRGAAPAAAALAAVALAGQLVAAWWSPAQFVPSEADRVAGDRLIDELRKLEGDVLIPFHPWYAELAGKQSFTHKMGLQNVSYRPPGRRASEGPPPWPVRGLREWLRDARFAAIVWDDRAIDAYFPGLAQSYRLDDYVPDDARPRVYTGARVVPKEIWVPARPLDPPPGARALWSFEQGRYGGWTMEGAAWGNRPVSSALAKQAPVRRFAGRYYATSMHGGDGATGSLFSPEFVVRGSRVTVRISGGRDEARLRAELHIDGELVDFATGQDSERMREHGFRVAAYKGKRARIVLRDRATGSWGHLNIDEIWEWD
jgi:hypothetical protein